MRTLLLCAVALTLALPAGAHASAQQETTFQDDDLLVYGSAEEQASTLDTMKDLGADRLRISVFWGVVAPGAKSKAKPEGFDGSDPGAYPAANWERYDRLLRLAQARGLAVNLNITGPAPVWATGRPERADIEATFDPSAAEYGAFVAAVAKRYSGSYVPAPPGQPAPPPDGGGGGPIDIPPPPGIGARTRQAEGQPPPEGALPRVDYWSIWNEPNQAGWLTPQWVQQQGAWVEAAPRIYRNLLDAAWSALHETGHGQDTILIGETAPKGLVARRGTTRAIDALRFVRTLYCLDRLSRPMTGATAAARGCPQNAEERARFATEHPALFEATGFAHHPYELTFAPSRAPNHRDWVTIANLPRLSNTLSRALRLAGRSRPGGLPLYLTEFGYQTNPPDRFGVTWAQQAAYLNESEFVSYVNPQVRTLAQFLLRDDDGDAGVTFQSGLTTLEGERKPSWAAFRLPIHLPVRSFRAGQRLRVWGLARTAPQGRRTDVLVEFRSRRGRTWRKVRTLRTDGGRGYLDAKVRFPGTGSVRLRWDDVASREVSVRRR